MCYTHNYPSVLQGPNTHGLPDAFNPGAFNTTPFVPGAGAADSVSGAVGNSKTGVFNTSILKSTVVRSNCKSATMVRSLFPAPMSMGSFGQYVLGDHMKKITGQVALYARPVSQIASSLQRKELIDLTLTNDEEGSSNRKRKRHGKDVILSDEIDGVQQKATIVYTRRQKHKPPVELNLLANFIGTGAIRQRKRCVHIGLGPLHLLHTGFHYETDTPAVESMVFRTMIECCATLKKGVWLDHDGPRRILMTGDEICAEWHDPGMLGYRCFELINRALVLEEGRWYMDGDRRRFRHPLHPHFANRVLWGGAADDYLEDETISEMFVGDHLTYDVETCTLITAEVIDDGGGCVLYVFDMVMKKMHVLDRMRMNCSLVELEAKHTPSMTRLLQGLCRCINAFFDGWAVDESDFTRATHRLMHPTVPREQTCIYVLHYVMYFDGDHVQRQIWEEEANHLHATLLRLVLRIKGNITRVPRPVLHPMV